MECFSLSRGQLEARVIIRLRGTSCREGLQVQENTLFLRRAWEVGVGKLTAVNTERAGKMTPLGSLW